MLVIKKLHHIQSLSYQVASLLKTTLYCSCYAVNTGQRIFKCVPLPNEISLQIPQDFPAQSKMNFTADYKVELFARIQTLDFY